MSSSCALEERILALWPKGDDGKTRLFFLFLFDLNEFKSYGFRFAVTPEQYCSVHNLFPFESYSEPMSEELREKIRSQPAAAALVMTDPIIWGRDIQVRAEEEEPLSNEAEIYL